ncbi:hypothetical protein [Sphingobacterium psychroaquaticum]|uniref:Uncharacterized protein n=1 Tax=Sphingobacterium psychroaquaticum TaxID=561061 RepID=A0A1X7IL39_9SPHI|nr:hypothetical protein [Sphingobacterium psychroaquaticum]SMG15638.1 hypothetical protein SAMN05660862_0979 [Sphingobacterium psychroaquaticum]
MKTTAINNKNTKAVANGSASNGKETKTTGATTSPKAEKEVIKFEGLEKEAPTKATTAEQKATPTDQQEQKPKFAPNLEETLKWVTELHRKKVQRDRLLETIANLDKFEVEVKDDADETDSNYYQGCTITIEDDNRNKFVTKNPVIIKSVALFVKTMCYDRLGEIEAEIAIPNV